MRGRSPAPANIAPAPQHSRQRGMFCLVHGISIQVSHVKAEKYGPAARSMRPRDLRASASASLEATTPVSVWHDRFSSNLSATPCGEHTGDLYVAFSERAAAAPSEGASDSSLERPLVRAPLCGRMGPSGPSGVAKKKSEGRTFRLHRGTAARTSGRAQIIVTAPDKPRRPGRRPKRNRASLPKAPNPRAGR